MEQQERERLVTWMQERGFDVAGFAQATGESYSYVHLIVNGKRPISDGFRWRFASSFGWAEAQRVFVAADPLVA